MTEHEKKDDATCKANPVFKEDGRTSSMGLDENIGGMLCYIFIIGLVFLFMEKENRFIRFHALQAVFLGVALLIANIALELVPVIGWIFNLLMGPFILGIIVFMMYQAYKGKYYKLPFVGEMAEKQLK
ncbi:DUF4870 domain-containing protein [Sporosarcina sp. FSL K6-1522]|uniref:DUF4870 domain-containing protein n=1 Tax=Sporosarcina sp. FSL K6-1522 TaxID=2921554 RepID=UPI00315B0FB9